MLELSEIYALDPDTAGDFCSSETGVNSPCQWSLNCQYSVFELVRRQGSVEICDVVGEREQGSMQNAIYDPSCTFLTETSVVTEVKLSTKINDTKQGGL